MVTREELYKRFGPLFIEALVLIIKDEINILRQRAGLSERNDEQVITALENKLNSLEKYNWMDTGG